MKKPSRFFRRAFVIAAVLLASTAVLGFSQGATGKNTGHPSEPGVLVISVETGSPAEKAGLARGDIILDVNGSAVNSQREVREAVFSHKTGETVSLTVRHGDAQKTLSVVLSDRNGRVYMGVLLLPEERDRTGMMGPGRDFAFGELTQGALVARVASGGPADKAGIKRGDIILSVDGVQIDADHNLSALIQDKKVGDTVTLSVKSRQDQADKTARDLKVTLGSTPDTKKPWLGVEYRMGFPAAFLPPSAERNGSSPELPMAPEPSMPRAPAPVM